MTFSPPGGTYYVQDLVLSGLPGSISLPPTNVPSTYSSGSAQMNYQISPDGMSFFPVVSSGPGTLQMSVAKAGTLGGTTTYSTELLGFSGLGDSELGAFMIRESPTKQSLGQHTVKADPRGYRVSSFFDVFLELSTDGGETWTPANRSIRLQASAPPAAPSSMFASLSGGNVVLQWQNNFTLQSTTDLRLPFTDVAGPITSGPYTNVMSGSARFFRLRN